MLLSLYCILVIFVGIKALWILKLVRGHVLLRF